MRPLLPGWPEGRAPHAALIPLEKTSPFLREVQVNLIDFRKCNDFLVYDSYLTPRMMCAGDLRGGRDSCQVRPHGQVRGIGICSEIHPDRPGPSFHRGTAGDPLCVSRITAGTLRASPAGALAVDRGTSRVSTPKSVRSSHGSTARWRYVPQRGTDWGGGAAGHPSHLLQSRAERPAQWHLCATLCPTSAPPPLQL